MTSDIQVADRRWYRFGPYVLDAPKRLLWRDRTLAPITSKAFEILLFLIQRRGRVVEKQELLDAVWPKTAVEENTLTRHISTLRKVLEERPDHHEYILTVPGHGYQFVADVVELDQRPDYLQHTLRSQPAIEELARAAAKASPDDSGPALPVMRIETASPDRAPVHAYSGETVDRERSRTLHGVGLAVVLGLAVVTTALVVAALRVDTAVAPGAARNLRQFTFLGGVQADPSWSPDGRRVAYSSEHAGNSDIFIQTVGETAPRQLTSSAAEDSQPDWSPNGESLVFRSETEGGGLFVISTRGGAPRRIASFGYHPQWSPAGGLILFSSSGHPGGNPKFYLVGLDGAAPVPLRPDILDNRQRLHAAWRPDGQSVSVWTRDEQGRRALLTAPIGGGAAIESRIDPAVEQRRAEAGLTFDRFVWAPSGRYLYFEGSAQETGSLWRITVDPETLAWIDGPDRLTTGTTRDIGAALSPDGKRVVFSARSSRTRLWMFPFDAVSGKVLGTGQPVTSGAAGEQDADALDDGTRLVYRTLRGARQQLWERGVPDGQERLLIEADEWSRTRPRWSPDGKWVSYLRRRVTPTGTSGDGAVAILSVDRREESLLTRPGSPQLVPTDWSQDGRILLGSCPRTETRTIGICVMDVDPGKSNDGTIRVLTNDPARNLFEQRFSPDQRWISFIAVDAADAGVSTIYIMPASGGPWQPVTDGAIYDDKPHWSPDGRTLYFVSHRDGVLNVWGRRIDPATGLPAGSIFQVTSFNSPRQMISTELARMQIAVTGNRLFLPITDTQSELWMLENVDR